MLTQFLHIMKALPSNNLKFNSVRQGCKYQVGKMVLFIEATVYVGKNGFQELENHLVSSGQVLSPP